MVHDGVDETVWDHKAGSVRAAMVELLQIQQRWLPTQSSHKHQLSLLPADWLGGRVYRVWLVCWAGSDWWAGGGGCEERSGRQGSRTRPTPPPTGFTLSSWHTDCHGPTPAGPLYTTPVHCLYTCTLTHELYGTGTVHKPHVSHFDHLS